LFELRARQWPATSNQQLAAAVVADVVVAVEEPATS